MSAQTAGSQKELPKTTESSSAEYIDKMASIGAYAMLPNPQWRLWFNTTDENRHQTYYSAIKELMGHQVEQGGFIMEAGDFAACASWQPPGSHTPPGETLTFGNSDTPAVSSEENESNQFFREQIWSKYGQEFWRLLLIARDPNKPSVPGAVRALIQPIIERAAADGKPIYLATSSEHAKDMYLHFGWQVLTMEVKNGHPGWSMILYPPSDGQA